MADSARPSSPSDLQAARTCGPLLVGLVLASLLVACGTPSRAPVERRGHPIASDVYQVRGGDTLWSIAWRAGLDYRQIADWNRLPPPYTIYPGQRLRLTSPYGPPGGRPRSAAKQSAPPRPSAVEEQKPQPVARSRSSSPPEKAPPRSGAAEPQRKPAAPSGTASASAPSPPSSPAPAPAPGTLRWRWPTQGKVVQGFAGGDATRKGLRIAGRLGQDVVAAESGKVVYSGSGLIGYGRLIIIKHNTEFLSAYGYNRKILVREGDQVTRGERIAEMGRIGGNAPMLHFEIRRRGKPVDPAKILPPR